eukprot:gnl/Spiro4/11375_TR6004_c0_g1_i1.p2 gnl/Spiro4/11375_TR6004_c0_g1~~gnl/Spiro4/11375_TR6004_c0_g1_i1.p2  ORF type:complete len:521 (-),score=154.69 gnl/Spiro4/11375_TR6004_c0_g1_i1:65-1627(-)
MSSELPDEPVVIPEPAREAPPNFTDKDLEGVVKFQAAYRGFSVRRNLGVSKKPDGAEAATPRAPTPPAPTSPKAASRSGSVHSMNSKNSSNSHQQSVAAPQSEHQGSRPGSQHEDLRQQQQQPHSAGTSTRPASASSSANNDNHSNNTNTNTNNNADARRHSNDTTHTPHSDSNSKLLAHSASNESHHTLASATAATRPHSASTAGKDERAPLAHSDSKTLAPSDTDHTTHNTAQDNSTQSLAHIASHDNTTIGPLSGAAPHDTTTAPLSGDTTTALLSGAASHDNLSLSGTAPHPQEPAAPTHAQSDDDTLSHPTTSPPPTPATPAVTVAVDTIADPEPALAQLTQLPQLATPEPVRVTPRHATLDHTPVSARLAPGQPLPTVPVPPRQITALTVEKGLADLQYQLNNWTKQGGYIYSVHLLETGPAVPSGGHEWLRFRTTWSCPSARAPIDSDVVNIYFTIQRRAGHHKISYVIEQQTTTHHIDGALPFRISWLDAVIAQKQFVKQNLNCLKVHRDNS